MEYPLIGLVVLVALVILWNIWSDMQVDLAVASLNATIAGTEAPAPLMVAGQWIVKALVGAVIGGAITAGATALFTWARKKWRQHNLTQHKWNSGPNAYWGQPRQPKVMSEAELYRLMLMQQMAGNRTSTASQSGAVLPTLTRMEDDEPTITF
jgi:uncharacterized protein (DUF697 family)